MKNIEARTSSFSYGAHACVEPRLNTDTGEITVVENALPKGEQDSTARSFTAKEWHEKTALVAAGELHASALTPRDPAVTPRRMAAFEAGVVTGDFDVVKQVSNIGEVTFGFANPLRTRKVARSLLVTEAATAPNFAESRFTQAPKTSGETKFHL